MLKVIPFLKEKGLIFLHKSLRNRIWPLIIAFLILIIGGQPVLAATTVTGSSASTLTITLNPGTKYATAMYVIDSGKPGPVVLITGGVHGNETAGYLAAARMKETTISKGKLLVIPKANRLAVDRGTRYISGEKDLNRAFPTKKGVNPSYKPAQAIYQVVKNYKVDWVMDMHEGYDYASGSTSSVGQSLIYYPSDKCTVMAKKILSKVNATISSSYRKFDSLRYPVSGSLARSTAQYLGTNSFIFETCSKDTLNTRINNQLLAANTLLRELYMK
ncbi:MAG: succinylglutamate desuccinylase/aspartoacylase family protein [Syntrophomonas sp.]